MIDLMIIYSMSVIAFLLYGWDKHLAVFQKKRIPEFLLLSLALLCGAFGALCGMIFFKHKTQHKVFLISVPVFLVLQLTLDVILRTLVW